MVSIHDHISYWCLVTLRVVFNRNCLAYTTVTDNDTMMMIFKFNGSYLRLFLWQIAVCDSIHSTRWLCLSYFFNIVVMTHLSHVCLIVRLIVWSIEYRWMTIDEWHDFSLLFDDDNDDNDDDNNGIPCENDGNYYLLIRWWDNFCYVNFLVLFG